MMFLHGGWMHLLMNMWMLWLFGPNIEDRLGHLVFLMFYVLGGVVAMLAFWASDPDGRMPVIGASGAVAAVLGAYAVTFPDGESADAGLFHLHPDHRSAGARAAWESGLCCKLFPECSGCGDSRWSRSPSGHTSAASWPA